MSRARPTTRDQPLRNQVAGATVYCTGRSVRGKPATGTQPETIEETAELVTADGGRGIAVQVDHTVESQVETLFTRIRTEQSRLDVLVNDIWGGDNLMEWGLPFWTLSTRQGLTMLERAVHTHIITSRHGVPLMVERNSTTPVFWTSAVGRVRLPSRHTSSPRGARDTPTPRVRPAWSWRYDESSSGASPVWNACVATPFCSECSG